MNRITTSLILFCAISLLAPQTALAVTIDTVPVGNAGNANDPATGNLYGGLAYAYRIGTTEVTVGQYTAFLNGVATTDTYGLYNPSMDTDLNIAGISRSGSSGSYSYSVIGSANKPVTYVSWGDAARFSNWVHNGQPGLGGPAVPQDAASTENGAYDLNGATTVATLNVVARNAVATWFIPTENEWYKAAYHQPTAQGGDADDYWLYPTRTNSTPNSDQPPGDPSIQTNVTNFWHDDLLANGFNDGFAVTASPSYSASQNYLTDGGAYSLSASPYDTYDQGGNVWEWNEAVNSDGSLRGARGGHWGSSADVMKASFRPSGFDPTTESGEFGFRLASVPEPSSFILAALGLIGLAAWGWRRKR